MVVLRQKKSQTTWLRRWFYRFLKVVFIVSLVFAIRAWHQRSLVVGEAPAFMAQALNGESIQLSTYRGQPLLLHFWMLDCLTCEIAQNGVSALMREYPVITIIAQQNDEQQVEEYMERQGIQNWMTIVDTMGEIHRQYGVMATPTNYVINAEGQIRFREVGLSSSWGLKVRMWLAANGF